MPERRPAHRPRAEDQEFYPPLYGWGAPVGRNRHRRPGLLRRLWLALRGARLR